MNDLYRLLTRNQDKILPMKTLTRINSLFPSNDDSKDCNSRGSAKDLVSEQLQVKLMAIVLREFRKNREFNKFRDQKEFAN